MSDRQGVEIDYCPECRGIWLDRGELDKILDRAKTESELDQPARQASHRYDEPRRDSRYEEPRRDSRYDNRGAQYPRKKKSPFEFLGDIFEG